MEYTDAPAAETEPAQTSIQPSPKEAVPIDAAVESQPETAEGKASDAVAVMLSVVPGLGHVYKGYKVLGLLFVIGAGFAILVGGLAATATAGFGLALIPLYWFAVMFHVYAVKDRVPPGVHDEGEQY